MSMWSAPLRVSLLLLSLSLVVACSSTSDRKAVYDPDIDKNQPLEVPPDLALPEGNDSLSIPSVSGSSSFSSFTGSSEKAANGKLLAVLNSDARLVRDGNMHWLEINAPAETLWQQLGDYFKSEGFEIKKSDRRTGFMETNWLENRFDIPSNWFSKFLKKLYSSGLRDKYRIRVEAIDGNNTRVFISHRGMKEEAASGVDDASLDIAWVMREPDMELETEMMMYFLVYRGYDKETASAVVKKNAYQERATMKDVSGSHYLEVSENFARTWRRTGIALDRIGIQIEDRNRSRGLYYLRVTEDYLEQNAKKKGWLSSLFGSSGVKQPEAFILKLTDLGNTTQLTVLDTSENLVSDKASQQFLMQLQQYLR